MPKKVSPTNETTKAILKYFFEHHIFAYRSNSVGVYDVRARRFRTAAKVGVSDITAVIPPLGRSCYVEIKTGRDKLRPEQEGFIKNAVSCGALCFVVKDYPDFLNQWGKMY